MRDRDNNNDDHVDEHFKQFVSSLRFETRKWDGWTKKKMVELQQKQVNLLSKLEIDWRRAVLNSRHGQAVYKEFVTHVRDELGNIQAARPFFRERKGRFRDGISAPLKERNWRALVHLHPNWQFIQLAMTRRKWPAKSRITKLSNEIAALRKEIAIVNLPLAISRTKNFWRRTQKSHLSFMDLLSEAAAGFLSGIDKFGGEYSRKWVSTIIGRASGNYIEAYSSTMLHFYPLDKQRLYRARKAMSGRLEIKDDKKDDKGKSKKKTPTPSVPTDDAILAVVNHKMKKELLASTAEVKNLLAAASTVSGDSLAPAAGDDQRDTILESTPSDDAWRPDVRAEESDALEKVLKAASTLSVLQRKVLRTKGIQLGRRV